MARIRNVKPDFFRHGEIYDLERRTGLPVRLAWIGLWCQCDCAGRFRWKPRELKVEVLPYDDLDFAAVLGALAEGGFVEKYAVGGRDYGQIPNFAKHQAVSGRELRQGPKHPGPGEERALSSSGTGVDMCQAARTKDIGQRTGEYARAEHAPPSSASPSPEKEPEATAQTVLAEYRAVGDELGVVIATTTADSGDAKAILDALPDEDDRRDVFRAALGPGAFRGPLKFIRQDLAGWWEKVEDERGRVAREKTRANPPPSEAPDPPADPAKVAAMLATLPWHKGAT